MNWTKFKKEFTLDPIEIMMRQNNVKERVLPMVYSEVPEARRQGIRELFMCGFVSGLLCAIVFGPVLYWILKAGGASDGVSYGP